MNGYVTCRHCHGYGKLYKWKIFYKRCQYCKGLGDIWVNNIDKYFDILENTSNDEKLYETLKALKMVS